METVRWEQHHPRKSQAKQGKNSGPSNWHEHYWARSGSGEHRRRQWLGMRSMHWYRGGDTLSGERTQCRHDGWHDLTMSWHWHCGGVDFVHPPHRSQHGHVLLCLLLSPTPPPSSSCPVAAELRVGGGGGGEEGGRHHEDQAEHHQVVPHIFVFNQRFRFLSLPSLGCSALGLSTGGSGVLYGVGGCSCDRRLRFFIWSTAIDINIWRAYPERGKR
ncbi:hypothetical protein B296_00002115 [Ensete ventricosum]|uniref:Uncharacterized protein n=1 Tax=Ensete ventricosum TaxID=4639 RepID=A0A427ABJ4_ENSVE|nr:hypothetical protein B296_00002115 [Ensete ventricosum]